MAEFYIWKVKLEFELALWPEFEGKDTVEYAIQHLEDRGWAWVEEHLEVEKTEQVVELEPGKIGG